MRQHTGPHQVSLRLVILIVDNHPHSHILNSQQNGLAHAVGHRIVRRFTKITLQNMRHHIRYTAGALIFRQSKSQLRVQNSKLRAQAIRLGALFDFILLISNHRVGRALATGRRNSQHHAQRQSLLHRLTAVKIQKIAAIRRTHSHRFGRINHGAAAHRQQKINSGLSGRLNRLINKRAAGVRLHAAQRHTIHTGRVQRIHNLMQNAATQHRTAAVKHQSSFTAALGHIFAGSFVRIHTKNKLGGTFKCKIFHNLATLP